jgi:glycine/D-amino acid oxidase-like deaminating enzyme
VTGARTLGEASAVPFWLDDPARPAARASVIEDTDCDLAVVGGGFSGIWTALLAKERDPGRDVVLVEANRIGWAASGRNGGFCEASLTHGEANGRARFSDDFDDLQRLGMRNLDEIEATLSRYGIDCGFERVGQLTVATEPYQVADLRNAVSDSAVFLDRDAIIGEVASPTYLAGLWRKNDTALINPAKLAWGLASACEAMGVRIYENAAVLGLRNRGGRMVLDTEHGQLAARRVALATNVFKPLIRRVRPFLAPVYDYVLVTEPLTSQQLRDVGWQHRQGIGDSANQFHYYRLTPDNRILWGGYDAIYHYGRRMRPEFDQRQATFDLLAAHFYETFPQLRDLHFTHRWGGAIDTCTRFCAFFGTAHGGAVAYGLGYTGLGVGASRFGAEVMLDLLAGEQTERTRTSLARTKPLPFPPEPLAYLGIQATRASLSRADQRQGRRNLWLRALDRAGLGFDS